MVVTKGPCFSLDARGTLGGSLTFAKVGKTNYAKKHFRPANPRSAAQSATRIHTAFVTGLWSVLNSTYRSNFLDLAEGWNLPLYHAYTKFNMRRWAKGLPPAIELPVESSFSLDAQDFIYMKTGRLYEVQVQIGTPMPLPLLVQVAASTDAGFEPSKNNTVAWIYPYVKVFATTYQCYGRWTAPSDDFFYIKGRGVNVRGGSTDWADFVDVG